MIETIVITVVGGLTAITCGSLWFVSVLDKRDRADEQPETAPAPHERVLPYHTSSANCAMCGQGTHYLKVKADGVRLRWECPICGGKYLTKTATG